MGIQYHHPSPHRKLSCTVQLTLQRNGTSGGSRWCAPHHLRTWTNYACIPNNIHKRSILWAFTLHMQQLSFPIQQFACLSDYPRKEWKRVSQEVVRKSASLDALRNFLYVRSNLFSFFNNGKHLGFSQLDSHCAAFIKVCTKDRRRHQMSSVIQNSKNSGQG